MRRPAAGPQRSHSYPMWLARRRPRFQAPTQGALRVKNPLAVVALWALLLGPSPTGAGAGVAAPARQAAAAIAPRLPSGTELLAAMRHEVRARGSVHFTVVSTAVGPGRVRITRRVHGDASWRRHALHAVDVTRTTVRRGIPSGTATSDEETVLVGPRAAVRIDHGSWECDNLGSFGRVLTSTVPGLSEHVNSPVNLGPTRLANVRVWHVRGLVALPLHAGTRSTLVDYYIAASDHTLRRRVARATFGIRGRTARIRDVEALTRYGEPLHLALPRSCRG
jgi:hypothetical protein